MSVKITIKDSATENKIAVKLAVNFTVIDDVIYRFWVHVSF